MTKLLEMIKAKMTLNLNDKENSVLLSCLANLH
jgi:hypothetical protein